MKIRTATQGLAGVARAILEFSESLRDNTAITGGTFNVGGLGFEVERVATFNPATGVLIRARVLMDPTPAGIEETIYFTTPEAENAAVRVAQRLLAQARTGL